MFREEKLQGKWHNGPFLSQPMDSFFASGGSSPERQESTVIETLHKCSDAFSCTQSIVYRYDLMSLKISDSSEIHGKKLVSAGRVIYYAASWSDVKAEPLGTYLYSH